MDALTFGITFCACLILLCVGFMWMQYRESAMMRLMSDTFDKIVDKTPVEAMAIVRRAYPGKPIRVFKYGEVIPRKYWQEDAVHLEVDTSGRIIQFSKPGGDGIDKSALSPQH